MNYANSSKRVSQTNLKVDRTCREHWKVAVECPIVVGQQVHTTAGVAELVRIHGKTGDGSRLLELRLLGVTASFFAAASNVLVEPTTPEN